MQLLFTFLFYINIKYEYKILLPHKITVCSKYWKKPNDSTTKVQKYYSYKILLLSIPVPPMCTK
jgi:hypothetical protein